jgi:hypothetical protein
MIAVTMIMWTGNEATKLMLNEVEICQICPNEVRQPQLLVRPVTEAKEKCRRLGGLGKPDSQLRSVKSCCRHHMNECPAAPGIVVKDKQEMIGQQSINDLYPTRSSLKVPRLLW